MNCSDCKQNMYHLLETENDNLAMELQAHLSECNDCRQEYDELLRMVHSIRQGKELRAPQELSKNIFQQIKENRPTKIRKITTIFLKIASVLLVAFIVTFFASQNTLAAKADTLIASAMDALKVVRSMFIEMEIRTKPMENFNYINADEKLVLHKMYKDFSGKTKWRVDKGGRVVVMNGDTTYLFVQDVLAIKIAGNNTNVLHGLVTFLEPAKILEKEQLEAQKKGVKIKIKESEENIFLSVTSKAEGIFVNNIGKNTSIDQSDNRREYVFDKKTHLLKSLKIFLLDDDKEILILHVKNIQYNIPLTSDVFEISLPPRMEWTKYEAPKASAYHRKMTPKEAAYLFLQDLSKGDFETNKELWSIMIHAKDVFYEYFGGLEIISVGEPFHSGTYQGYYVPYEIKLKNGQLKKHRLAISNNNPNKTWQVEGGL